MKTKRRNGGRVFQNRRGKSYANKTIITQKCNVYTFTRPASVNFASEGGRRRIGGR